ncbi:unnamed protein product [Cyprideis torosa]|uniref:Peroxisomal trans-2-enoyl-CoA reductase n=1 Tax=Cyprideis torosa TaxID=163714 RepID=A0A7R8WR75_9CRUS|nr:unnamed protein product [Cyprideis torosa]CAG0907307.1 unnamed protein product [Cyprideis torosa]
MDIRKSEEVDALFDFVDEKYGRLDILKKGVILNMTANVSRGFPGMAHTGAARAGVENLTKTLASEWGEYHIRINSLSLGVIKSSGLDNYPEAVQELLDAQTINNTPLGRLGSTADVADASVFLVSDLSSFITGAIIPIDGGQSLAGDIMTLPNNLKNFGL